MKKKSMKNNPSDDMFVGTKTLAIIGQKGLPPEFSGTSGVEFYVSKHIPPLIRRGVSVTCFVRRWATPANVHTYMGATLIRLPSVRTKHLDAVSHSLISTVWACFSSVDTVWFQATGPALFSFLPRLFRKKVIVTLHALEWKRAKWDIFSKGVLRFSEWVAVKSAHTLVTVSESIATYVATLYGVRVIVDEPEDTKQEATIPRIIIKKYGLRGNDYILYLGRFVPEKRIEWLIRAYQHIHPKNIRLVLAGGEVYGRAYTKKLKQLVQNDEKILFAGWVFGNEKRELMSNCKLFVLPSSLEGNPIALHELPKTVPVVVSDDASQTMSVRPALYRFRNNDEHDFVRVMNQAITSVIQ